MRTYLFTFEIEDKSKYDEIKQAVKAFGYWAQITEFTFVVNTEFNAREIRDYFLPYLDEADRFFVVKTAPFSAWKNPLCGNDWLNKYLKS